MEQRVFAVLEKYKGLDHVIVCCHGMLMQYVLEIPHPDNGQVVEYRFPAGELGLRRPV